jgi:hypothetical protein
VVLLKCSFQKHDQGILGVKCHTFNVVIFHIFLIYQINCNIIEEKTTNINSLNEIKLDKSCNLN